MESSPRRPGVALVPRMPRSAVSAVTRVFDGVEDQKTSWNTWVTEVSAF